MEEDFSAADQLRVLLVMVPHLEQQVLLAAVEVLNGEVFDPLGVQVVVNHLSLPIVDVLPIGTVLDLQRTVGITLGDEVQISQILRLDEQLDSLRVLVRALTRFPVTGQSRWYSAAPGWAVTHFRLVDLLGSRLVMRRLYD